MSYDNDMKGVLFKNDRKESEKHADYRGQCEIQGVEMWVSAWVRTSTKDGRKFMSLSFEPKEKPKAARSRGEKWHAGAADDIDAPPF